VNGVSDVAVEVEQTAPTHGLQQLVSAGSTIAPPLMAPASQPELLQTELTQCLVDDPPAPRTNPSSIFGRRNNLILGKEPDAAIRVLHVSGTCQPKKALDLEEMLMNRAASYRACYLDQARSDPTLAGKLRVEIMVEGAPTHSKQGLVWSLSPNLVVRVLDDGMGSDRLSACISRALKRFRIASQGKKPPLSCRFEVVFRFWLSELEPPREWLDSE
jgi:hypothetical protein